MDKATMSKAVFIIIFCLLIVLSFLIIQPYLSYIIMAFVLAFLFKPLFLVFSKKIRKKTYCAAIAVALIILIIVIPAILMLAALAVQANSAYQNVRDLSFLEKVSESIYRHTGYSFDVSGFAGNSLGGIKDYVIKSVPSAIGSVLGVFLGLFVMSFVMYYLFKEGDTLYSSIKQHFPLKKKYKDALFDEFSKVTKGVLYGQIVSAIVQGIIAGIGFFIFGIPNPLFWGFVMIVLAVLPIGAPLVWIPACMFEALKGNYFAAVGMFCYGLIIVSNIDNLLKPRLISSKSDIHPAVVLVGVLGGLQFMGFIGLFVGPLILEIMIVFSRAFKDDFFKKSALSKK